MSSVNSRVSQPPDRSTEPRSGPPSCNTGGSKSIQDLGEFLGYLDPEEPPPPTMARAQAFVWLTSACMLSYCHEGLRVPGDASSGVLAPTVRDVANPDPPAYENHQALAWGIDSLTLGATMQVDPGILERLEELKNSGAPTKIASGPFRMELEPYGAAPHWRYILRGPAVTVRIRSRPDYDLNCQVELRSAFLWSVGADGCVALVREMLNRWALQDAGAIPELEGRVSERSVLLDVSRLDMCADIGGELLDGSELVAGRWITRARRRTCYTTAEELEGDGLEGWHLQAAAERLAKAQPGHSLARLRQDLVRALGGEPETRGERITEHVRGALYIRGKTMTGYSFGAGAILCRVYRKDLEIKSSDKRWMRELWQARRYDGGPVWRIEFQLRTPGLATFLEDGKGSRRWVEVRRRLDGLWAHLTARDGGGWLSLRDVGQDKTRRRWPVTKWWGGVQRIQWGEATSLERMTRGAVVRASGDVARIATREDKIRSWCAGTTIEAGTGRASADQLGAQLAGVAAAFTAATQIRDQEHDPTTDAEARKRMVSAFERALDDREAEKGGYARTISDAADRLVIRANWRRTTTS